MKAGREVMVALVIDPRHETHYIHRAEGIILNGSFLIQGGHFLRLEDTYSSFPSGVSLIYEPFVPVDVEGTRSEGYFRELLAYKGTKFDDLAERESYARNREQAHWRQWQALDRCWSVLSALAPPEYLNHVLRVRDDVTFFSPFVVLGGHEPKVLVPGCDNVGGANDKMLLAIGHETAKTYLTAPLQMMQSNFDKILQMQKQRTDIAMNPESVLLNTLLLNNVTVEEMDTTSVSLATQHLVQEQATRKHYVCVPPDIGQECIASALWEDRKRSSIHLSSIGTTGTEDPVKAISLLAEREQIRTLEAELWCQEK
jgi:hypothetical protein